MSSNKNDLITKILIISNNVKILLGQITKIENDLQTPTTEKLSQIKKIKQELIKVGTKIDEIKRSIILLNDQKLN